MKTRRKKVSNLDSQAINELVQDAAKQNDDWEGRGTVSEDREIPLLMKNKVPEGYETDDHLDVSLRPDEPEDTDYDSIPIESFGMAMLKGMGWKQGQGIGKNNKAVAPVEAVLRPKGMGLGADRKQAQSLNDAKQGGSQNKEGTQENLVMAKGAFCLIEKGPYKDLYAVVEGMDEDNARLMVKLTVSGKSITVSQYNTRIVGKEEYNKYSKYLNKGATDRYKEKQDKNKEKEKNGDYEDSAERKKREKEKEDRLSGYDTGESGRSRDHNDRKKDKYDKYDRSDRQNYKYREDDIGKHETRDGDKSSRKRDKNREDEYEGKSKKQKKNNERSGTSNGSGHSSPPLLWVKPKLRVRIVSDKYKKGKYYNTKVSILDVLDETHCVCQTDDGRVLEDLSQSMLETVVPRSDSSYVSIVSGRHAGQLAHVLERNKKAGEATLQLLSDRDRVVVLDYDSICEYVGDVNEEFDF